MKEKYKTKITFDLCMNLFFIPFLEDLEFTFFKPLLGALTE